MPNRIGRISAGLTTLALIAALGGCAAVQTSIAKKDLVVQTNTSTAIFVDPVPREKRTVYVSVRSGVQEFDRGAFTRFLKDQFANNQDGFVIVDDPDKAHFQMLVYVLNLEKTSPTAAQAALSKGYEGEMVAGAAVGAVVGARNNAANGGMAVGAVAGGLLASGASLIADNLVHDTTFMLVADVAIKEKVADGVIVRKDTAIDAKVSDSGSSQQRVSEATDKKEYRTRIVTTANKANLELAEARDQMFSKTAYAMSGFF